MTTSLRLSAFYLTWLRTQRHLRSITSGGPRRPRAVDAARRKPRRIQTLPVELRIGA